MQVSSSFSLRCDNKQKQNKKIRNVLATWICNNDYPVVKNKCTSFLPKFSKRLFRNIICMLFSGAETKPHFEHSVATVTETTKFCYTTNYLFSSLQSLKLPPHLYCVRPSGWIGVDICGGNSTPAVSVVPFRSNTPLKSPSSVRVKSGQVHIFQLRYLKRCGSSAK